MILACLVRLVVAIPILFVFLHTMVRIARHFHKFPMPEFMADLIDNPLRRRFQPPYKTAVRHGLEPGMMVLEVGPGNGTYTVGAAQRIGASGRLVTIDIEPRMVERVRRRAAAEGLGNVTAKVADVYDLPFNDETFDIVYMITVIGEIPDPVRAMGEFHRVLSPSGKLVFSELLLDPDFPLATTVVHWAAPAGFRLKNKIGSTFNYTLIFEKDL